MKEDKSSKVTFQSREMQGTEEDEKELDKSLDTTLFVQMRERIDMKYRPVRQEGTACPGLCAPVVLVISQNSHKEQLR